MRPTVPRPTAMQKSPVQAKVMAKPISGIRKVVPGSRKTVSASAEADA